MDTCDLPGFFDVPGIGTVQGNELSHFVRIGRIRPETLIRSHIIKMEVRASALPTLRPLLEDRGFLPPHALDSGIAWLCGILGTLVTLACAFLFLNIQVISTPRNLIAANVTGADLTTWKLGFAFGALWYASFAVLAFALLARRKSNHIMYFCSSMIILCGSFLSPPTLFIGVLIGLSGLMMLLRSFNVPPGTWGNAIWPIVEFDYKSHSPARDTSPLKSPSASLLDLERSGLLTADEAETIRKYRAMKLFDLTLNAISDNPGLSHNEILVPLEFVDELSRCNEADLSDLTTATFQLMKKGLKQREIVQRLTSANWSHEFANWYVAQVLAANAEIPLKLGPI